MSDALKALILDLLGSVILGSIFVGPMLIVLIGRNLIRRRRLRHAAANETFLARYRAEHPEDGRATDDASPPGGPAQPADAGTPSPASAGLQWSQP